MSSSASSSQTQSRDSSGSSSSNLTKASSSSRRVLPETTKSEQTGPEAQSSQSPAAFPAGTTTNVNDQEPSSPQLSQYTSSASSSASHPSPTTESKLKPADEDIWSQAIQGPNVPEEVKAIVRTGRHVWSRGIVPKTNTTATPAESGRFSLPGEFVHI